MTHTNPTHDKTFTDFTADLGVAASKCLASAPENFELSSASVALQNLVSNSANTGKIEQNYAILSGNSGSFVGTHSYGLVSEPIQVIICSTTRPGTIW